MNKAKFNELRKMALRLTTELGLQSEATSDPSVEAMLEIADELVLALDDFGHDQGYLEDDAEVEDFGLDDEGLED